MKSKKTEKEINNKKKEIDKKIQSEIDNSIEKMFKKYKISFTKVR